MRSDQLKRIAQTFFSYVVPIALGITILVYLIALYQTEKIGFWQFAPLVVASIATVFAGVSAILTNRTLDLTRATQRPFLTTVGEPEWPEIRNDTPTGSENDIPRVLVGIRNAGNLPADRVSIICALCTGHDGDTRKALTHAPTASSPLVYFPGVQIDHTFYIEAEDFEKCKAGEFTIRVRTRYDNLAGRKTHMTDRFFDYAPFVTSPHTPKNVYHKKDYWD